MFTLIMVGAILSQVGLAVGNREIRDAENAHYYSLPFTTVVKVLCLDYKKPMSIDPFTIQPFILSTILQSCANQLRPGIGAERLGPLDGRAKSAVNDELRKDA